MAIQDYLSALGWAGSKRTLLALEETLPNFCCLHRALELMTVLLCPPCPKLKVSSQLWLPNLAAARISLPTLRLKLPVQAMRRRSTVARMM